MDFKLTYSNASTVTVTVSDKELGDWLDGKAKQKAVDTSIKAETSRGTVTKVEKT